MTGKTATIQQLMDFPRFTDLVEVPHGIGLVLVDYAQFIGKDGDCWAELGYGFVDMNLPMNGRKILAHQYLVS